MKIFYSTLVLIIILSSCGTSNTVTSNHFFQKRKYTSGWNLNHSTKVVSSNSESIKENKATEASLNSTINLEKSTSNLIELRSFVQVECDTIILTDGKIVRATILSSTDSTINYTKCESDDPAEFTINKKEIKALQYANGKFEFIKHQSAKEANKIEEDRYKTDRINAQEERWQTLHNTDITEKELKEKLTPRYIGLKVFLTIVCFLLVPFCLMLGYGYAIFYTIAICFLILALYFLAVLIKSLKERHKEKTQLLREKAK